jgi:2-dehydropantoate 2-reductase
MRIVILGAGAMGCLFGGLLQAAGHRVTLVDVSPAQIDAINRDGLRIERDGVAIVVPIEAAYARDVTDAPETVIVFTKTIHTRQALESARPILGPETTLVSVQNGLGNKEIMEDFAPAGRIVVGVTTFPADLAAPGHVRTAGSGFVKIMAADGRRTPVLEAICEALDTAGLTCEISPEVETAIWEKVAFNAALNTVAAITGFNVGMMADSPEARQVAHQVAREVTAVANRRGVEADPQLVAETINSALGGHRDHKPSMLQDVLAGRRTEIDSLNGAVVKEAQRLGMEAPAAEVLYLLVKAKESAVSTAE